MEGSGRVLACICKSVCSLLELVLDSNQMTFGLVKWGDRDRRDMASRQVLILTVQVVQSQDWNAYIAELSYLIHSMQTMTFMFKANLALAQA